MFIKNLSTENYREQILLNQKTVKILHQLLVRFGPISAYIFTLGNFSRNNNKKIKSSFRNKVQAIRRYSRKK